jgi:undecaprenyl-diphosphatase
MPKPKRQARLRLPGGSQPLVWLLCLSGLVLFAMLTDEMREGGTRALDAAVLTGFRTPGDPAVPIGPKWLLQAALDLSALGGFTVLWLLALGAAGYLMLTERRADALLIAVSLGGGWLLDTALKRFIDRARPDVGPHLVQVSSASYPSGHAMLSAVAYLTLGAMLARAEPSPVARAYLLTLAVVLVVLIGLSRLYLGVHWPSDVAAGWCVGSAWALGTWALARRLTARRESTKIAAAVDLGRDL